MASTFSGYSQYVLNDTVFINEIKILAKAEMNQNAAGSVVQRMDSLALIQRISGTLGDVLAEHTPVFIKSQGRGAMATASIRGTGASHTAVLWNNIPINSSMNGQVDFSLLPVYFTDELDIFYGSASLQNSSGALGGSIAINNPATWVKGLHTKLIQGFGSYKSSTSFGQVNWSNGKVSLRTRLFFESSANDYECYFPIKTNEIESGFRKLEGASYKKGGFLQEAFFKIDEHSEAGGSIWYQQSDRNIPALVNSSNKDYSQIQQDRNLKMMAFYKHYGNILYWELQTACLNDGLDYQMKTNESNTSMSNDAHNQTKSSNTRWFGELKPWQTWRFTMEMQYQLNSAYTLDNITQLGYSNNRQEFLSMVSAHKTMGERWNFSVLLRGLWVQNQSVKPIPSFGAEYLLSKTHQVRVKSNVSRNYHVPSLNDLYYIPGGNPDLTPEKGNTAELGMEQQWKRGSFHGNQTVSSYYSEVNEWIQWTPTNGPWEASNLEKVVSKGLEYQTLIVYELGPFISKTRFQYAFSPTTNESEPTLAGDVSKGQQLIYIPLHSGSGWFYLGYKNWELNWLTQYLGQRQTSTVKSADIPAEPAYWLTNVSLGLNWNEKRVKFGIRGKVENLFNATYSNVKYRPMPLRNYSVLLKLEF
jgi:outer membrane cobalamin receptor